ncbi:SDR family oxidoreductase [Mycobacterium sp. URHB0044]|uniref:SDR family oxidoreductase n=1 Tax=Mycobacterium sp. URHB0044 TaxID=1380386 RepID=UPI00048DC5BE|nr:SDR family oxidoreductase [Mycobacterium sp. URHB0044]
MKVVVVGQDELIARAVASALIEGGHHVATVHPRSGDVLAETCVGARVVVDVTDPPSYDGRMAWDFLSVATTDLVSAVRQTGVMHLVALSAVGTGRLLASSYFRAKAMRERVIADSGVPFTILRGTQCFESLGRIADSATDGDAVRISPALIQPIAADDLASAVATAALDLPVGGVREAAGPRRYCLDDMIRANLRAHNDTRCVLSEPQARYLGARLDDDVLLPSVDAAVYPTDFADWLARDLSRHGLLT